MKIKSSLTSSSEHERPAKRLKMFDLNQDDYYDSSDAEDVEVVPIKIDTWKKGAKFENALYRFTRNIRFKFGVEVSSLDEEFLHLIYNLRDAFVSLKWTSIDLGKHQHEQLIKY
jgi:hypothetical protein